MSRKTFARLDCYSFWLRRNIGRNYPSYSALLDALLDEVLEADPGEIEGVRPLNQYSAKGTKKASPQAMLFCVPRAVVKISVAIVSCFN